MRTFRLNNHGLPQSEDGIVIDPYFAYEMALYKAGEKQFVIPWEVLTDASGSWHRFFLRSTYLDGQFGKPLPESQLDEILRDLETALSLVKVRYEIHR
jgi:hypothetical protein